MTQAATIYTVEYNGRVFDVEGPAGASPQDLQAFVEANGSSAGDASAPIAEQPAAPTLDNSEWGFSDQAREAAQSAPTGSNEYVKEVNEGILDGSIASPADLSVVANRYGYSFPDQDKLKQVFDQLKAGAQFGGANPAEYAIDITDVRGGGGVGEKADAFARGVAGSVGLDDEIDALRRSAFESGSYDENLARARAIRNYDEENNFGSRLTGELLGGIAIPLGIERAGLTPAFRAVAAQAGRNALRSGATIAEARAIAARAATGRLAREGAVYGGISGAGRADGDLTDRAVAGAGGVLAGAAAGAGLGAVGQAMAPRAAAAAAAARAEPLTEAERVAAAATRQGVDILPADVAGPTVRRLTAAGAQAPLSAAPIINAGQRAVAQVGQRRDRIAALIGEVLNPEAAGERALAGAQSFIRRTSDRGGQLYRAAEQAGNGVTVTPTRALDTLNRNISELRDTPGGAAPLERLEGLREALQNGQFTVPGIRRMRTVLRDEFIRDGLTGSDAERRVNQVVDAAADDVTASLASAGRTGAARQFQLADRYWRNRLRTIDENIRPIIGKNGEYSGEQVVQKLQAAAQGNNQRFAAFLNALPDAERGDVRASLIGRLGRATDGAQNAEGDAFSLQTFLTHWNKIGETAKARLFGPESRAALNDLATLAGGARETAGYANRSNTAGGIWGNIGALFGASAVSPAITIGGLVAQYGGGRLLASPRFARWLTRPPTHVAGLPGYVERLSRIARAEPAIANDVLSLQTRLRDAFTGSPARLAADERRDGVLGADGNASQQDSQGEGAQP